MKPAKGAYFILFGFLCFFSSPAEARQISSPGVRGQQVLRDACTGCHDIAVISGAKKSGAQWEETIADMVERGAPLIGDERQVLVQFLTENYGAEGNPSVAPMHTAARPSTEQMSSQDARGRRVLQEACTVCHDLELVYQSRRSLSEWEELVNDMIGRGAAMLDGERDLLLQFLGKHYAPENPKTNINLAPTQQLIAVFGLSQVEAEAIARYRQQSGTILGWEDLRKIQTLDLRKLEAKRELLAFF